MSTGGFQEMEARTFRSAPAGQLRADLKVGPSIG